jgi:guanine deaminase
MLVRGGRVLRPGATSAEPADVLIDGDRIAEVARPATSAPAGEALDARGCLVVPGLINAHTHGHTHLARGIAGRWTLEDLLNHGPALNANRTPEEQYLSAALGAIEMLKSGCTSAYDLFMGVPAPGPETAEAIARAYIDVGLRAIVAPAAADLVFYATVPGLVDLLPPDLARTVKDIAPAPAAGLLGLTEATIRRWHGAEGGRIRVAVAPTIPTQCTDEFLVGCGRLAREFGVGLHTHLAESKVQAVAAQRRWGRSIVARLEEVGVLGPGFVGAHGIWLTDDDVARLAAAGGAIAHNPGSNLRLGAGIAAVREMLDHGLTVAIGTDGSVCSDNQNVFEAMRIAALVGNVRFPHDPARWLSAAEIWGMATLGGARLMGMPDELGAVAPGRKADLVLLREDSTFLSPLNDPFGTLVYAETGAAVDTVLVGGRVVLRGGKVLTVDEARLREAAQDAADRVRTRNPDAWQLAAQLGPYVAAACRAAVATPYPVNRYAAPVAPHLDLTREN